MVVSEIGEQWSPNRPPERTAPTAMANGMENAWAIGMARGIIIAKVPHELPVEKDTNAPNRKMAAGTSAAEKLMDFSTSDRKSVV